jgi:hypothetical protein
VLVQDHVTLEGGTQWKGPHAISPFRAIPDKGPIQLQDHGNPRPLPQHLDPAPARLSEILAHHGYMRGGPSQPPRFLLPAW